MERRSAFRTNCLGVPTRQHFGLSLPTYIGQWAREPHFSDESGEAGTYDYRQGHRYRQVLCIPFCGLLSSSLGNALFECILGYYFVQNRIFPFTFAEDAP